MPQVVEFPALPSFSVLRRVVERVARASAPQSLREVLAEDFDAQYPRAWYYLLELREAGAGSSAVVQQLLRCREAEMGAVLAERLWALNPPLAAFVLPLLDEKPIGKDDLAKLVDSTAYHGARLSKPMFDNWLAAWVLAGGLKKVGIAVGVGPLGESYRQRAAAFDCDAYLARDVPLEDPLRDTVAEVKAEASVAVGAPEQAPVLAPRASVLWPTALAHVARPAASSPHSDEAAPMQMDVNATPAVATLQANRARLGAWLQGVGPVPDAPALDAVGLGSASFVEHPDDSLFRVAVFAALLFRLPAGAAPGAYRALIENCVLDALYHGEVHDELTGQVDTQGLLLASLLARRMGAVALWAQLETAANVPEALAVLEGVLAPAGLHLEVYWILASLLRLGVLRCGLATDVRVPYRVVRDALFRFGAIDTPYAATSADLWTAAVAARDFLGEKISEEGLAWFVTSAGCASPCPQRKRCKFWCRERSDW